MICFMFINQIFDKVEKPGFQIEVNSQSGGYVKQLV